MSARLDVLRQEIRHAVRGLRRAPGFTLTVVLTLALGIGANTAIFSVVDQLLLRPLPYPDGQQLLRIYESEPGASQRDDVSPANWFDWQRQSQMLESLAAWRTASATLTGNGNAERVQGQIVSAEFFPLLGVEPLLGRVIAPEHDRPNAPLVAVLSHSLWERRFGNDPDIVGRIIQLDETPAEIIGVMPAGFRLLFGDTDIWAPLRLNRDLPWRAPDRGRFLWIVARMKPAVTLADARKELQAIAHGLAESYEFNRGTSVELVPLREEIVGDVRISLLVLYGGVLVLLSIACFNVANLIVARSMTRRHEIAVRMAIGASRSAIIRQLLVECVVLASIGGVLGVLVAGWSLGALAALTPPEIVPFADLRLDVPILVYALALTLLTGVTIAVVPGIAATRSLSRRGCTPAPGRSRTPHTLGRCWLSDRSR